jgi:hypothetical protein
VNVYFVNNAASLSKMKEGYTANISDFNKLNTDSNTTLESLKTNLNDMNTQSSNVDRILAQKPNDVTEVLNILVLMKSYFENAITQTINLNGLLSRAINIKKVIMEDDPTNTNVQSINSIVETVGDNGLNAIQILNQLQEVYYNKCKTVYDYSIKNLKTANRSLSQELKTKYENDKRYAKEIKDINDETKRLHNEKKTLINEVVNKYTIQLNEAKKIAPAGSAFIEYIGSFRDSPSRPLSVLNEGSRTYSLNSCANEAIEGKYSFFALQDGTTYGKGQCLVGNDISKATTNKVANPPIAKDGNYYGGSWVNSIYKITSFERPEAKNLSDAEARCYLSKYPDLTRAFGGNNLDAAKDHWLRYGYNENRNTKC